MEKIRVLLVEDNLEMCDILKNFFQMTNDTVLCGVAHDGESGLELIRRQSPDIVVLDIVMPKMDGISVLENLHADSHTKMPHIIVVSAIGQENITQAALSLGANYYMIKPYSMSDLHKRIRMIMTPEAPRKRKDASEDALIPLISQNVMELGVPTNILGFKYIIESVRIIIRDRNAYPISKCVYAVIAEEGNTTVECVESAVRKAINRIFETGAPGSQQFLQGGKKPTNVKFLTMLAEKIKRESRG